MGILDASQASGGSVNSARSQAMNQARTYGREATAKATSAASIANSLARSNWQDAANFNAEQAQIQREWQERMANTVYQRSVKDMVAAGINPILAAGNGLGSAAVGSGASASINPAASYMQGIYPESESSGQSASESQGSSWNNSESGLVTALTQIGGLISSTIAAMNSSKAIDININGLRESLGLAQQDAYGHPFSWDASKIGELFDKETGYTSTWNEEKGEWEYKKKETTKSKLKNFLGNILN